MRQQTLMKIIGLMRKDIDKNMTILNISKKLKIGYRPAYNHVLEMEKESIILMEKTGNSNRCRLNLKNQKTKRLLESLDIELKEEIYNKNPKLKLLEVLISKLVKKYISEIYSIVLFGSYAENKQTKFSDIDIMFIVNNIKDKKLRSDIERECSSYQYSHNLKVSPLITDIKELNTMLKSDELNVGKEIREKGISLYGHEIFWRIIT